MMPDTDTNGYVPIVNVRDATYLFHLSTCAQTVGAEAQDECEQDDYEQLAITANRIAERILARQG